MLGWLDAMPSMPALLGQLLIGTINGGFYAILSLGLAVIFGLLNIINFAHGAQYMVGAFVAYFGLTYLGLDYWYALILVPLVVGASGILLERLLLRHCYRLNHLYGLLLTFGLALVLEGLFRQRWGVSGLPYSIPDDMTGGQDLGFMFLPNYRAWVIFASLAICLGTWLVIERTRLGTYLRAATENPALVRAFGINVPLLISLTYGFGVGLAALAGVLAAPIYQVSPVMGSNVIIVVFAVVVIGGMGSIFGAIVTGLSLGIVESVAKLFYPEASAVVIFLIMAIVLVFRPAGLFGKPVELAHAPYAEQIASGANAGRNMIFNSVLIVAALVAPFIVYPEFLMNALCFALFACAFNLLVGYGGLLSFGHAAFMGGAAYATAYLVKAYELPSIVGILAGTAVAACLGILIGWIAIRRHGIYFAMITLALSQVVYFVALQAKFTGGEDGIQAVPRGSLFGIFDLNDNLVMYYFVLAIFLIGFAIVFRTIHSPFGQILKAIRDNEPRAISLGYRTQHYKLLAFVLSAALAGLAGSTKALVIQLATLSDVHWMMSGDVVLITLVGGLGTILGPIVGAFIMVAMDHFLAPLGSWITVVQGSIFILCVLTFRRGVVGTVASLLDRTHFFSLEARAMQPRPTLIP